MLPMTVRRIYGIFTYMFMVDFYGKLVGKYTSPMDLMGYERLFLHIPESYDVDIYVKDMVYFQNESRIQCLVC